MKLTVKRAIEQLQHSSEKLSDVTRQLAFGAFAIAWIFKVEGGSGYEIPNSLVLSTAVAVLVLVLDMVQNVYAVVSLQIGLGKVGVVDEDRVVDFTVSGLSSSLFFYGKIILVGFAYSVILYFFLSNLT